MLNNIGPTTLPCGTPLVTVCHHENESLCPAAQVVCKQGASAVTGTVSFHNSTSANASDEERGESRRT